MLLILPILLLFAIGSTAPLCADEDYFPFQVGNRWTYQFNEYKEVFTDNEGVEYYFDEVVGIRYVSDHFLFATYDEFLQGDLLENIEFSRSEPQPFAGNFTLEIVGTREFDSQVYYLFNTSLLLRKDVDGSILSYDTSNQQEILLFDFSNIIEEESIDSPFKPLAPFLGALSGVRPSRNMDLETRNVAFSIGDGVRFCEITFTPDIGISNSRCGSDVETESIRYQLIDFVATSVPQLSWGGIKKLKD